MSFIETFWQEQHSDRYCSQLPSFAGIEIGGNIPIGSLADYEAQQNVSDNPSVGVDLTGLVGFPQGSSVATGIRALLSHQPHKVTTPNNIYKLSKQGPPAVPQTIYTPAPQPTPPPNPPPFYKPTIIRKPTIRYRTVTESQYELSSQYLVREFENPTTTSQQGCCA